MEPGRDSFYQDTDSVEYELARDNNAAAARAWLTLMEEAVLQRSSDPSCKIEDVDHPLRSSESLSDLPDLPEFRALGLNGQETEGTPFGWYTSMPLQQQQALLAGKRMKKRGRPLIHVEREEEEVRIAEGEYKRHATQEH